MKHIENNLYETMFCKKRKIESYITLAIIYQIIHCNKNNVMSKHMQMFIQIIYLVWKDKTVIVTN